MLNEVLLTSVCNKVYYGLFSKSCKLSPTLALESREANLVHVHVCGSFVPWKSVLKAWTICEAHVGKRRTFYTSSAKTMLSVVDSPVLWIDDPSAILIETQLELLLNMENLTTNYSHLRYGQSMGPLSDISKML